MLDGISPFSPTTFQINPVHASVEAAVTETRVVVNTVGSFWSHTDHVAERAGAYLNPVCANNGIHYLSISQLTSGKIYDYQARENDAIPISCCGFESVPAHVVWFS